MFFINGNNEEINSFIMMSTAEKLSKLSCSKSCSFFLFITRLFVQFLPMHNT